MRFLALFIIAGFLSTLFGCKKDPGCFQTDEACANNRGRQLTMTLRTLARLRKRGVTDKSQLKLEYYFYTNTKEKAAALAQKLADMGYTGRHDRCASDKKQFLVTGCTSRIKMDNLSMLVWTSYMCDVGHEDDCEFDGWSANPERP
jgi:hypothetical protein